MGLGFTWTGAVRNLIETSTESVLVVLRFVIGIRGDIDEVWVGRPYETKVLLENKPRICEMGEIKRLVLEELVRNFWTDKVTPDSQLTMATLSSEESPDSDGLTLMVMFGHNINPDGPKWTEFVQETIMKGGQREWAWVVKEIMEVSERLYQEDVKYETGED